MNETEYIAAINELDAQCEHDADIDRTWVDRGKSRRVRRKQARKGDGKTDHYTGCTCDWCCPPERPGNKRRRIAADEQLRENQ